MTSAFRSPLTRLIAIVAVAALVVSSVAGAIFLLQSGSGSPAPPSPDDVPSGTPEPVTMEGTIPLSFAVVEESSEGPCTGNDGLQTLTEPVSCLQTGPSLEVDRVKEAKAFPIEGSGQAYVVTVSLQNADAKPLENFTSKHVGEKVAIIADGQALLAPRLDQPIRRGMLTLTDPNLGRAGAVALARRFTG